MKDAFPITEETPLRLQDTLLRPPGPWHIPAQKPPPASLACATRCHSASTPRQFLTKTPRLRGLQEKSFCFYYSQSRTPPCRVPRAAGLAQGKDGGAWLGRWECRGWAPPAQRCPRTVFCTEKSRNIKAGQGLRAGICLSASPECCCKWRQ